LFEFQSNAHANTLLWLIPCTDPWCERGNKSITTSVIRSVVSVVERLCLDCVIYGYWNIMCRNVMKYSKQEVEFSGYGKETCFYSKPSFPWAGNFCRLKCIYFLLSSTTKYETASESNIELRFTVGLL
jgi:hypothetical protein